MKTKCVCVSFLLLFFYIPSFSNQKIFENELHIIPSIGNIQSKKNLSITDNTNEITTINPDTFLINYFNQINVKYKGISIPHIGNLETPTYSRIFFERKETSQFLFQDACTLYRKDPNHFKFFNTKTPYSNISYQRIENSSINDTEYIQTLLTFNFGKNLNMGFNVEYQYAFGFCKSQLSKHIDQIFFVNYISDRHRVHYFTSFNSHTSSESWKITNNKHNQLNNTFLNTKSATSNDSIYLNDTWNKLNENLVHFDYCYNFKFYKKKTNENYKKQSYLISNITYTMDYRSNKKKFYTYDSISVDNFYIDKKDLFRKLKYINDFTYCNSISNIISISMMKNVPCWKNVNFNASLIQEFRLFNIIDTTNNKTQQSSIYICGNLTKQLNKIFRYNIKSNIGILGYNSNDLKFHTSIEAHIPFLKDTITSMIYTCINHLSPTYYENHYSSRYFYWNNNFNKIEKKHIGSILYIPYTKTSLKLQLENIKNYIFFNKKGNPQSYIKNIQIFSADLIQNFKFNAFNFDSQITQQISTNQKIIPLPTFSLYSNAYFKFKPTNVLTIKFGTNIHFWEKYCAYSYEPALQQFILQDKLKVGNYPLINSYIHCDLKQAHFLIEYYNIWAEFISNQNYFSHPNSPISPPLIKLEISIDFID
ncbi:MAG: putative porin [Bacteroidales bacterium OttesenSCG-928-I14]|jgi:hypothetical protein|nr:putative porin [Bacteroidales bacterium OttesenSCG-928-I14]